MTDDNRNHPVFDLFGAAGYAPEHLVDPGFVTPDDIASGTWRLVRAYNHGVEGFDVDGDDLRDDDRATSGVSVEFGCSGSIQPIAFGDERGPLWTDEYLSESIGPGINWSVSFFYDMENGRTFPNLSEREAVETLGLWGADGSVPVGTAEAILSPFGGDVDSLHSFDDPDIDGEKLVNAPHLASKVASLALGEVRGPDSDISGHKKRDRQRFYRNLDALKEAYNLTDE